MNAWTQFLFVTLYFFFWVNLSSEYIWPSYKSEHNPIPGESCSLHCHFSRFPKGEVLCCLKLLRNMYKCDFNTFNNRQQFARLPHSPPPQTINSQMYHWLWGEQLIDHCYEQIFLSWSRASTVHIFLLTEMCLQLQFPYLEAASSQVLFLLLL